MLGQSETIAIHCRASDSSEHLPGRGDQLMKLLATMIALLSLIGKSYCQNDRQLHCSIKMEIDTLKFNELNNNSYRLESDSDFSQLLKQSESCMRIPVPHCSKSTIIWDGKVFPNESGGLDATFIVYKEKDKGGIVQMPCMVSMLRDISEVLEKTDYESGQVTNLLVKYEETGIMIKLAIE